MENLWIDGRTPPYGRLAGNLVLDEIGRRERLPFERVKGTVFASDNAIVIGRFYRFQSSSKDQIHWCNLTEDELADWTRRSAEAGKQLEFLLITLRPRPIKLEYWLLRYSGLESILLRRPKKHATVTVVADGPRQMMNVQGRRRDVQGFYRTISLTPQLKSDLAKMLHEGRIEPSQLPIQKPRPRRRPSNDANRTVAAVEYTMPLRREFDARILLPRDLSVPESKRLATFVRSLAM